MNNAQRHEIASVIARMQSIVDELAALDQSVRYVRASHLWIASRLAGARHLAARVDDVADADAESYVNAVKALGDLASTTYGDIDRYLTCFEANL